MIEVQKRIMQVRLGIEQKYRIVIWDTKKGQHYMEVHIEHHIIQLIQIQV